MESHAHPFSKTHSKTPRQRNDQYFQKVGDFGGMGMREEREEFFSFSPEYYSPGKGNVFPFFRVDRIVYNQWMLV
jgi:hypothetical protein